mmetsp:Transcript_11124/g.25765  ORF Transcript_11124/g.25765 Transcript_11124/m.25765 type:complete len:198 (+) Transcript_11124:153-746(+)|eukprot:CAMPEP_0116848206 /NCGR_PEP_ID=MMETSP0418-20121206/14863_1 /TAXON_ID=1158023 /ORGANISM="Astrosyne radiata, Strain 13vi08-1A" /LENGTH=197 /DNA_ID=CAMNT_0004479741 /DNA_START=131 /DNA_END=724 /DNA_ORIENTATION=+
MPCCQDAKCCGCDWEWLKDWAPEYRPVPWIFANLCCCTYSIYLFFIAVLGLKETKAGIWAEKSALGYNFIITAIWCAQAVLQEWAIGIGAGHYYENFSSISLHLEALLAIYFLFYSFWHIWKRQWKDETIHELIIELIFNTIFYFWMVGRDVYKIWKRRQFTKVDQEEADASAPEKGGGEGEGKEATTEDAKKVVDV